MRISFLFSLLCCVASLTLSQSTHTWPNVVNIEGGTVVGETVGAINRFRGIPYAAPPTGEDRWRLPKDVLPWVGVKNTTTFGPACPQPFSDGYTFPSDITFAEDCLYLNVYAPKNSSGLLPTMVWIHGGGLTFGSGAELRLNGQTLAEVAQVVVVTINYRLGPLGFLGLHSLLAEGEEPTTGNYGIYDQQKALLWVQNNIAKFGGDKQNVTIMGESAGGSSVCFHIVLPSSKGLFVRAIAESSACFDEVSTLKEHEDQGKALIQATGCYTGNATKELQCLRNVDWKTLLQYGLGINSSCVDGYFFTQHPYKSLVKGNFNSVPLMAGDVAEEGTVFIYGAISKALSEEEYLEDAERRWPGFGSKVLQAYPCSAFNPKDCRAALSVAFGDAFLQCPTTMLAVYMAVKGHQDVHTYLFSHHPSWNPDKILGAYHSSEIEFVFGTITIQGQKPTPREFSLSKIMVEYWGSFGVFGNPNTLEGSRPGWPGFFPHRRRLNLTTTGSYTIDKYGVQSCQFWDTYYAHKYYY